MWRKVSNEREKAGVGRANDKFHNQSTSSPSKEYRTWSSTLILGAGGRVDLIFSVDSLQSCWKKLKYV